MLVIVAVFGLSLLVTSCSSSSTTDSKLGQSNSNTQQIASAITVPNLPTVSSTPTLAPGSIIPLPSASSMGLTLIQTNALPAISLDTAEQAVANLGITWAKGGQLRGKTVKLQASFGLATFGGLSTDGKTWLGPVNFSLRNCDDNGNCVSTGVTLPYIQNRAMWILDYGNTVEPVLAPPPNYCQPVACTPVPDFNHSVYAVDALTKYVIEIWFYYGN